MFNRAFSTLKHSINITTTAWNKMLRISEKQNKFNFLFSATSGGCNGYNYKLDLIDDSQFKKIMDEEFQRIKPTLLTNNNTKLLVDPVSEFLLLGTTIDYVNEDYSKGIFENKFIFTPNKNLASTCGCGISFTPKNE